MDQLSRPSSSSPHVRQVVTELSTDDMSHITGDTSSCPPRLMLPPPRTLSPCIHSTHQLNYSITRRTNVLLLIFAADSAADTAADTSGSSIQRAMAAIEKRRRRCMRTTSNVRHENPAWSCLKTPRRYWIVPQSMILPSLR